MDDLCYLIDGLLPHSKGRQEGPLRVYEFTLPHAAPIDPDITIKLVPDGDRLTMSVTGPREKVMRLAQQYYRLLYTEKL